MSVSRWRRVGTWGGAVVAVVLAVHGAVWFVVTGRILDGLPGFVDQAGQAGWRVEHGPVARTGWPWAAAVRVPNLRATRDVGGLLLRWATESTLVVLRPDDPKALQIEPQGEQAATLGDDTLRLRAERLAVRVPLDGVAPIGVVARGIDLGNGVRAGHLTGEVTGLALGFTLSDVVLARPMAPPFDGGFALTLAASTSQPFGMQASSRAVATQWRERDGRITVPRLELRWGPLLLTGSGTGGLDAGLQPVGRAMLHVTGAPEALDAATRAGLVAPGPASAIRAVLGLLALAAPGGAVALPVTLEAGTVTMAQFPLAKVPHLDWDSP